MTDNSRSTIKFKVPGEDKDEMRAVLRSVFDALTEKGYNPINQIVGYLLTEDPTYITNYNNARSMICKIDRDELLQELVRCYLFDKA
ncbi:MAG TPA: IreB family regulatory phosphoprotein [Candidatus Faecousia excrementipullorum]|nr:IreB family regulatory phosphoprotein [Candidatus Faecousia excrementipullorum]